MTDKQNDIYNHAQSHLQNHKQNPTPNNLSKLTKQAFLLTSILLLTLSTVTSGINAQARQQDKVNQEIYTNPQAILNVSFKDNVYLDNILDNELNSEKNWSGINFKNNSYGITNLSGLSTIGGQNEMITISGQYNPRQVKKAYTLKNQELITKIDDLKNNGSKIEDLDKLSKEDKESLSKEINKMNGLEVKRQRYLNWESSKILGLSLVGNTDTLTSIKTILDNSGHTKVNELLITEDLKTQITEITKILENKSEKERNNYLNILIKSEIEKIGITGNIEEYMRKEIDNMPEYIKNPLQMKIEDKDTSSFETITGKIINGLLNGTQAKAALPAWLGGVSSVSAWISFRLQYYFWTIFWQCSKNLAICAGAVWGYIQGVNTLDDIRKKIFN
jgi:hypothetical protein